MNLVVVQYPATNEQLENDSELEFENESEEKVFQDVQELERKLRVITTARDKITLDLKMMVRQLDVEVADVNDEIKKCLNELKEIVDRDVTKILEDEDAEEADRKFKQYSDAMGFSIEEQKEEFQASDKVKNLFRKISRRTHPDKTKNQILHSLFIEARKCYKNNDYHGLLEIFKCVQQSVSLVFMRLNTKRLKLMRELSVAEGEVFQLVHSNEYQMYKDWSHGRLDYRKSVIDFHRSAKLKILDGLKEKLQKARMKNV